MITDVTPSASTEVNVAFVIAALIVFALGVAWMLVMPRASARRMLREPSWYPPAPAPPKAHPYRSIAIPTPHPSRPTIPPGPISIHE